MASRTKFGSLLGSLMAGVLILGINAPALASSRPSSHSTVGPLTSETDTTLGYRVSRPASWSSIETGDTRTWVASDGGPRSTHLVLSVTNLQTIARRDMVATGGRSTAIANYLAFQRNPSLAPWMSATEAFWKTNQVSYARLAQFANSRLYTVRPGNGATWLVAYVIDKGQPLGLALVASGPRSDLRSLRQAGTVADFSSIVRSAVAVDVSAISSVHEASAQPTAGPQPQNGDSGFRMVDVFQYRLMDTWQRPVRHGPVVIWLYEFMYYTVYKQTGQNMWLYRTNVTDTPDEACQYGSAWSLYQHSIPPNGKEIDGTTGKVADGYYAYKTVAHLYSTTAHMSVFGNPLVGYCQSYYPY